MEEKQVDIKDPDLEKYFMGAVRTGNAIVLEELLSNGLCAADIGKIDDMCCEEYLTISGHSEALEVVLKHSPVKTWIENYHQILKKHNPREYLIWQKKNSCRPEMTTMNRELANRKIAMFAAIRHNQPACLDLILTYGVDFRARTFFLSKGVCQPMATVHLAATLGMSDCIDVLMRHETRAYADKSIRVSGMRFYRHTRDVDGTNCWKTPMILAAENGHRETMARFKKHGINIDGTNTYNHLSSCIRFGAVDAIFVLCQHGAKCYSKPTANQFTPEGPLHHAIKTGNIRIVEIMLRTLGTVDFRSMVTDQTNEQVAALLKNISSTPRTLSHLCRHVIREVLGEDRCYFGVDMLPLPKRLKSFVRLVE